MMNISQLSNSMDSLKVKSIKRNVEFPKQLKRSYYNKSLGTIDGPTKKKLEKTVAIDYFSKLTKPEKLTVIETASNIARSAKAYVDSITIDRENEVDSIVRYEIEWHRKFTLSIACLVLFFIGAPLGAIIRKGGLGMPVVISIVFFIIFHVLSITGEKLAKEGSIPAIEGMWIATVTLLPIGIILTYKATADRGLFDINFYFKPKENSFWMSLQKYFNSIRK